MGEGKFSTIPQRIRKGEAQDSNFRCTERRITYLLIDGEGMFTSHAEKQTMVDIL
jgi:hypothetical protein